MGKSNIQFETSISERERKSERKRKRFAMSMTEKGDQETRLLFVKNSF